MNKNKKLLFASLAVLASTGATTVNAEASNSRDGLYLTGEAALATMSSKGYNVSAMQAQYSQLKDQFMTLPAATAGRLFDSMSIGFKNQQGD